MNQATIDKLKLNPHYKAKPNQLTPDGYEPEPQPVRSYGVLPKQNTMAIPKHPTEPKTRVYKKKK